MSWQGYRKFRIAAKVQECENVFSFHLAPVDGQPLLSYRPGQYLTFRLHLPGQTGPVVRCYSLSEAPGNPDHYRITVKKILPPGDKPDAPPGLVSSYFVDSLQEGDELEVKAPAGVFTLEASGTSPVVLLAGGIGLTPLLSMLNAVVQAGSSREVWLFHGVRNTREHMMKDHLERLAREHPNIHLQVCYSRPTAEDRPNRDYQHHGHVRIELLKKILPAREFEYYVCGPSSMMDSLMKALQEWGVPKDRIFFERFGAEPPKDKVVHPPKLEKSKDTLQVTFAKTGKTIPWDDSSESILEFAEANGINLEYGCRSGNCGTCSARLLSGEVVYEEDIKAETGEGEILTCSAIPVTDIVLDA